MIFFLSWSLFISFYLPCLAGGTQETPADGVCATIARSVSSASQVFFPGDPEYAAGISHYAVSSTQQSQCVVEPGTAGDVSKILVILSQTRTLFAVKGGGHATNVGFSSTLGVQIFMTRFSEVKYDVTSQTAEIGAGMIWDDVYSALEPFGVNVVGGRVTGIGVAGFTLGGGYSWKSNQYGLTLDSVLAFQLVLPNGRITTVTEASDSELFFGLKGGYNNFGIVTKFKLKTYPQTQVWGGVIDYLESEIDAINDAIIAYQMDVTDPKAALIATYNSVLVNSTQEMILSLLLFYDAPTPSPGIFDAFLAIPQSNTDISTRNFLSLVQSSHSNSLEGTRVAYQSVPMITFNSGIANILVNETKFWGQQLLNQSGILVSTAVEIFLPSLYSHNPNKTAYPPIRNIPFQPFNLNYVWNSSEADAAFHNAGVSSAAHIRQAAIAQGQAGLVNAPDYPNYAISETPLEDIYGDNLPALRALKARIDPENVMGLAGGWKF